MIMASPVKSALSDYQVRELLGSGSYGSVYKVIRRLDGHTYALKEVDLQGMGKEVRFPGPGSSPGGPKGRQRGLTADAGARGMLS